MRRKDREITDQNEILRIMRNCEVCNVALTDGETPYVIPMNFGILEENKEISLCFHCAPVGKKIDLIRQNPRAAFSMSCGCRLEMTDANSCTMRYESVCGSGMIREADEKEKILALNTIMRQYRPGETFEFDENLVRRTMILILKIDELTGKRSAPKA